MSRRQTIAAPCKVNLHLGVYAEKDGRGYHRVDSVMIALNLYNTISIEDSDFLSVRFHPRLDNPVEKNAAHRAAVLLASELGLSPDVRIDVQRSIPEMGGLGSSSADAGGVLRGLSERWGVDVHDPRVVSVARRVGADVPFCLDPVPSFLVGGGDVLKERFTPMPGLPIVLVIPGNSASSTRQVYDEFDRQPTEPASPDAMCAALRAGDVVGVAEHLSNNLAPAAERLQPIIAEGERWLRRQPGVLAGQVTGSGSCSFAICESREAAERIAAAARSEENWWAKAVLTVGLDGQFC